MRFISGQKRGEEILGLELCSGKLWSSETTLGTRSNYREFNDLPHKNIIILLWNFGYSCLDHSAPRKLSRQSCWVSLLWDLCRSWPHPKRDLTFVPDSWEVMLGILWVILESVIHGESLGPHLKVCANEVTHDGFLGHVISAPIPEWGAGTEFNHVDNQSINWTYVMKPQ